MSRAAVLGVLALIVIAGWGPGELDSPAALATSVVRPASPAASAAQPAAVPHPAAAVQLVVLGDSVASGAACSCTSFGQLLASSLAAASGGAVGFTNAARDGLTTQGLLDQLQGRDLARALARATVVTVTIGANDFDPDLASHPDCLEQAASACYRDSLAAFPALLQGALARIRALAPSSQVLITGYWNVFLDGDVGTQNGVTYVHVSDALTRTVNADIAQQASAGGATYVDLYDPFERRPLGGLTALLAPDGDHPSASGHELISRALLDATARTAVAGVRTAGG
ncbi:MAG: hypothetical protein NVS3B26_08200 [Mycobacteriales bacterium]